MKKTLSLAVCALALASVAEPQKLLEITIADRAGLLAQAAQLGNMTATPMIGMMAAGAIAENPLAAEFGAPRDGEVTTLRLYGESIESQSFAVVYPASEGPAAYEAKKGLVATNGIYTADGLYVGFTSDGKWAAAGSTPEVANLALAKAGTAKLAQGEAVRLDVTPAGLALAADACEALRAACPNEAMPFDIDKDVVKHLDGLSLFLRVTEKGLDFQYSVAVKPDSPYAKVGTKPFSVPDPLAFAGKDAIFAGAAAPDCGNDASGAAGRAALAKLWEKHAPSAKIVACERNGAVTKATLDMKALFDFMQTEEAARWVESLSDDAVLAEVKAAFATLPDPSDAPAVGSPESFVSFAIKGQEFASTASARFAKAMPEVKAPFAVGVVSVYGGLRHAVSAALDADTTASDEDRMAIEMARGFLMALPPEGDGCLATAMWREGPKVSVLIRATPEELKGLAALVNLASSMIPFGAAAGCGPDFGEELPDDEEE